MSTRNYRLIAVNERSGNKTTLSDDTLTHDQACAMKGKFSQHKERRIELEEVDIMNAQNTIAQQVARVREFKTRNPLGAIRTIQYEGKGVTAAISCYRVMHGVMMYGVYDEKHGYTYYSPDNKAV